MTRFGLPEVKLGLIPGAGGTQRLPRLIGPEKALKVIVTGDPIGTDEAKAEGLIEAVMTGPFPDAAIAWTRDLVAKGATLKKVRDRDERLQAVRANPKQLDDAAGALLRRARGTSAAKACLAAVKAAVDKPFDEGLALERKLFTELVGGDESRAQRHIFFAEREALKVPDVPATVKPKQIKKAVMIGGGTMGGGIAMNFANVGIPVTIIETSDDFLKRGISRVAQNYKIAEERGSMAKGEHDNAHGVDRRHHRLQSRSAEADIIIEAVFEDMDLKKEIFARSGQDRQARRHPGHQHVGPQCRRDRLGHQAAAGRGRHALLQPGERHAAPGDRAWRQDLARDAGDGDRHRPQDRQGAGRGRHLRRLRRQPHPAPPRRAGHRMLLEGALPHQIDDVMVEFGFPMGPFAMGDLAGLDIGYQARKAKGNVGKEERSSSWTRCVGPAVSARRPAPATTATIRARARRSPTRRWRSIVTEASKKAGITRREISKEEILDRLVLPMLNEGARILEEGIAIRASDIDVIWVYGYGWPVLARRADVLRRPAGRRQRARSPRETRRQGR